MLTLIRKRDYSLIFPGLPASPGNGRERIENSLEMRIFYLVLESTTAFANQAGRSSSNGNASQMEIFLVCHYSENAICLIRKILSF